MKQMSNKLYVYVAEDHNWEEAGRLVIYQFKRRGGIESGTTEH